MPGIRKTIATIGLLGVTLLPMIAAVPPEAPAAPREPRMPVAIAQPLAIAASPIVATPVGASRTPTLPEPGMLVLVGSALLGLAALVRKTT